MIGIQQFSGVLTHIPEELEGLTGLEETTPTREKRTTSPCGAYAVQAFAGLSDVAPETGLICISGATGSTVKAFDKAWHASEDGKLTGTDFSRRAKRIHPFTLVRSLQNQTPAVISMEFGVKGPCINALDSATSMAAVLPNIDAMLEHCPAVALIMAAAGDREEEKTKIDQLTPGAVGLEGSLCFLLTRDGALGYLEPVTGAETSILLQTPPTAAPALSGGLAILQCMAQQKSRAHILLEDFSGYRTFFEWRNK